MVRAMEGPLGTERRYMGERQRDIEGLRVQYSMERAGQNDKGQFEFAFQNNGSIHPLCGVVGLLAHASIRRQRRVHVAELWPRSPAGFLIGIDTFL